MKNSELKNIKVHPVTHEVVKLIAHKTGSGITETADILLRKFATPSTITRAKRNVSKRIKP